MRFNSCPSRSIPVSFSRFYNKRRNTMQSQAFHPTHLDKMSLEHGIALDFLSEHTPMEIEGVLMSISDTPEGP